MPKGAIGALAVPLIGVVSAALLLGEPLGAPVLAAVVLTILGVWLALAGARSEPGTRQWPPNNP